MKHILLLFLLFILCLPKSVSAVSFTIENPVLEGDYFIVDASISGITAASAYVQGMFTSSTSSNFFGFTWGQKEDWVEYQSSTTKDFITTNFPILLKNTSQKIWIRPNYSDTGFKGSGDYYLKLKRYTGSSDSDSGESNTLTVSLIDPSPPTPTTTTTPAVTITPEPTLTLAPTRTPTPTPVKNPTPTTSLRGGTPTRQSTSIIPTVVVDPRVDPKSHPTSSTQSSVLGDSTNSAFLVTTTDSTSVSRQGGTHSTPSASHNLSSSNDIYKYTFIFGAILSSISGAWLYFRHKKD